MSVHTQASSLLILTSESSEADRTVNALRAAGLTARATTTEDISQIASQLEKIRGDLVLCCSYDPAIDLNAVLAAHRKLTVDAPLIVITEPELLAGDTVKARRGGARDILLRNDQEHLQMAVSREFSDLCQRREARKLLERLQHCEKLGQEFIDTTIDSVAFVQAGLHLRANMSYLALFGYDDQDDLEAAMFLDMFPSDQQSEVRDFLRTVEFADPPAPGSLETVCQRQDEEAFPATLHAVRSELDGEPCVRILVRPNDYYQATKKRRPAAGASPAETREVVKGRARILAELGERIEADFAVPTPFAFFFIQIRNIHELVRDLGLTLALDTIDEFEKTLFKLIGDQGLLIRATDIGFALIIDNLEQNEKAEELAARIRTDVRLSQHATAAEKETSDCEVTFSILKGRAIEPVDILNSVHLKCVRLLNPEEKATKGSAASTRKKAEKAPQDSGDAEIVERIQFALKHDQFKLVYQPIISLMGDNQEHYTVLVRLIDQDEELFEAKDFIEPAIRNGLIEQIDRWTIRNAIRVLAEHRHAGHNISFFINLSEDSFRNTGTVLWICDCLREFDVRGNWLTFQFQETLVAANLASLSKLVEALKKIKCKVAISQFGESERPEMLLQGLSLDFALFVPSFANALAEDQNKQKRVIDLANLTREFNVKSVVTGVEDARALTVLWTAGVDYVQGNFLQRPSPTLEIQA